MNAVALHWQRLAAWKKAELQDRQNPPGCKQKEGPRSTNDHDRRGESRRGNQGCADTQRATGDEGRGIPHSVTHPSSVCRRPLPLPSLSLSLSILPSLPDCLSAESNGLRSQRGGILPRHRYRRSHRVRQCPITPSRAPDTIHHLCWPWRRLDSDERHCCRVVRHRPISLLIPHLPHSHRSVERLCVEAQGRGPLWVVPVAGEIQRVVQHPVGRPQRRPAIRWRVMDRPVWRDGRQPAGPERSAAAGGRWLGGHGQADAMGSIHWRDGVVVSVILISVRLQLHLTRGGVVDHGPLDPCQTEVQPSFAPLAPLGGRRWRRKAVGGRQVRRGRMGPRLREVIPVRVRLSGVLSVSRWLLSATSVGLWSRLLLAVVGQPLLAIGWRLDSNGHFGGRLRWRFGTSGRLWWGRHTSSCCWRQLGRHSLSLARLDDLFHCTAVAVIAVSLLGFVE
mmetsp:Transcript_26107/g.74956  ORF Transcript_26107/g.74956 Transcript_26107/m.74956 type:complete len:449 (-) Transcript_26107:263-1609(-)